MTDNAYCGVDDEVLEVTPTTKKKGCRSGNYSTEEDKALIMAWESVSIDPIAGTDQNMKTYWKRIGDHFYRNVTVLYDRTLSSLSHWWSSIQECCNRWAGCVTQVDRAKPSGMTDEMLVSILHYELYGPLLFVYAMISSNFVCHIFNFAA